MKFYFPIFLMVLCTALYNIAQKSVPPGVNPYLSIVVTYVAALGGSLVILALNRSAATPLSAALKELNWASYGAGFSIIGVELGVLLAYRAGWALSLGWTVANVCSALLLLAVGLLFFREHLRPVNLLGVGLCVVGMLLVLRR